MNRRQFFMQNIPDYDLDKLDMDEKIEEVGRTTLDASLIELADTFEQDLPYRWLQQPDGSFKWVFHHHYIDKLMEYFMEGTMARMNKKERLLTEWLDVFEDSYSTSALITDNKGDVIGATNPADNFGRSFIVDSNYRAQPIEAQPPYGNMPNADLLQELDKTIMTIVDGTYVDTEF